MQLNRQLILFRHILKQFGYDDFESLREDFNTKETGTNATGRTYFASVLQNRTEKRMDNQTLFIYDDAIQEYEKKLRENRAEPFFSFKYYQWFSLLFTEYFFDRYKNNLSGFIDELNVFRESENDFRRLEKIEKADLKKLAFWMATGSGKTLIMHCNLWQIQKHFKEWENIILITPNEGLSRQHYENFTESGIEAKLYSGSEESLKTKEGEVLIIEITKLVKEKEGEGVSVDVDYFAESKNLILIDEGHKGQKSEEKKWKSLRQHIARSSDSFTFEYSATFGQVISTSSDLLQEYGKSILFDYSYRHFYTDGYGKDFSVFNVDVKNNYSEEQNRILFTASLLGFYEQLVLFEKYKDELRPFNIEKPLWIFVGSKVIGRNSSSLTKADKQNVSDVTRIIGFFKFVLTQPGELQKEIDKILSENTGLRNSNGDDIFKGRFKYLNENRPEAEAILQKVFNGIGSLEAFQIKQAEGEIGLKTKTSENYFAVINIGDVPKYSSKLEQDTGGDLVVQDDNFTKSLFFSIEKESSPIQILIGSKKFIEGWNSWRVSCMGLMNMGKGEGAQIIQLFGRGVRLKGKEFSLKREESNAPYQIKALQTIFIFGLNADYMTRFLNEIEKEAPNYREFPIQIKYNQKEKWNKRLMTFKTKEGANFKNELVELTYNDEVAKRVSVDLRNKVSIAASGFNSEVAEDKEEYAENFLIKYFDFIDFESLFLEVNRYRILRGYSNLILNRAVIRQIIKNNDYQLQSHKGQFDVEEAVNGKMQEVADLIVKDYINKFYADREKEFLTRNLTYQVLNDEEQKELFPKENEVIVKIPEQHEAVMKELKENIQQLYQSDSDILPSIHFGRHLYSPIASWKEGVKYKEIKTVPVRLNEGERDFIKHLRSYFEAKEEDFKGKEIFVLRNLSQKGIGFFIESSSFYPDFIIWIVEDKKQQILFVDPKGIRETRNFNNPKVIFCRDQVKELEARINAELKADKTDLQVDVSAWILSVTAYKDVKKIWGSSGATREEFEKNRILFIEENWEYLGKMFG
jgi:hypothetical protein